MEESINPTINIGPVTFDLTLTALTLLSVAVIFGFIYWASRSMTLKPKGKQNVLEYIHDFVVGFTEPNVGSRYMKDYSLFYLCLFLFMVIANNLGLMAKLQMTDGTNLWTSPTANLQFDLALSFGIILMTHIEGIRRRGVKKYLKAFVTPGFMTPMNLLEEVTNFLSLALRVFGNIFAGEVMTSLLILLSHQAFYWYPIAFVTNLVWTAFSVFISCVQAYVFTVLSSMYLGNKINDEE
ncbi:MULTISPECIES: F0F1 ATP synthase subunit A [Streptococcus]|jgi:ATP synthase F0, A subunit|uniref:ATP synthase subunit a n=2 Tax=Streptococcus TaxID=1301 RepID=A0A3R9JFU2_STRMT|nr:MULTISPECIES: F0F1 ATP synthase subunit A [Streptococcus]EGR94139.1 ATP synthase F0, A subunit [Streptococcus mitis bv. 2 str. F0392]RSI81015.1 ATP synthase subunit a [Streptococcus mitis]RSJ03252.1 ATP synthase subunit a [Streptococcus mitis]RSJ06369.1 ATP synthase subunit a [Streptococcus mitis]UJD02219.1 F0F1 ATP synthase subunit A [Streptococcus oralis]